MYMLGTDSGTLYAFSSNGTVQWQYSSPAALKSAPAIDANGTIYLGLTNGDFHAISPGGEPLWTRSIGSKIYYSSLTLAAEGTMYVGTIDQYLYALDAQARLKWRYQTNGTIYSSPTLNAKGILYIGSTDGSLYALLTDNSGPADSAWPMLQHDLQHTGQSGIW